MKEIIIIGGKKVITGDIGLIKGNGLLAWLIRKWLRIYSKKLGVKSYPIYNHAFMFVELWGMMCVAEALGRGVTIRPFKDAYYERDKDICLLSVKEERTAKEKNDLSKYICSFSFNPTRYDFVNFLYQMKMIIKTTRIKRGKWSGKSGDEAKIRLYCSEAVAWWTNFDRKIFDNSASVNPFDIYINKGLKILHDGQKVEKETINID